MGNARRSMNSPLVCRLGAVASYGFVSNLTYGAGLAVAWIAFVRQVGKSPLMAGQWKAFLAFYAGASLPAQYSFPSLLAEHCSLLGMLRGSSCLACRLLRPHAPCMQASEGSPALHAGFWTVQNFVRPLRFSVALAMAPLFEMGLTRISRATGFSRRNSFGVYLFILGSLTSLLVFGSIFLFAGPLAYARA